MGKNAKLDAARATLTRLTDEEAAACRGLGANT
ncbi:hypothetical protein ABIB14_000484 [Arthrobacter sp. UYEF3]